MERLAHDLGHTQKHGVPYITVNPHSSAPRRQGAPSATIEMTSLSLSLVNEGAALPSCLPVVNPASRLYKVHPDQIGQSGASSWFQPGVPTSSHP